MVPRRCGSAHWNRKMRDACNTLPLNFIVALPVGRESLLCEAEERHGK